MTTQIESIFSTEAVVPPSLSPVMPINGRNKFLVEYASRADQLSLLRDEWEKLEGAFATPLLSHDWFSSCADAFKMTDCLEIIAVRAEDQLRALAPLSYKGKARKRLEIIGSSVTGEPGGFLYSDRESLEQLLDVVTDLDTPIILKGIRFASPESVLLESLLRSKRRKYLVREENLPWVSTHGRWEDFEKQISSSRRSSFRRLQRLAESKGKLEYEVNNPTPDDLDRHLSELFDVEASSWKGRTGTAMETYAELGSFFRKFSLVQAQKGRMRIFFLRVNGTAIAGQLTLLHANRLWVFKIGHNELWSWCSPGILLMHRVIKHCFDEKLDACELLGSDEPWLHIWADETHPVLTYRIYPGVISAASDISAEFARLCAYKLKAKIAKQKRARKANAAKDTK